MTVHFEATEYLRKVADIFSPEGSKIFLQEVKWAVFYPYNVPYNQF